MGFVRSGLLAGGLVAAVLAAAAPASAAGPITKGLSPYSTQALRPGVSLMRYTMTVNDHGKQRTIRVWKVAWTPGPTLDLNSAVLGTYYPDDRSVRLGTISRWSGTSTTGFTAAINGDYFSSSYQHSGAGRPSGLLVHDRRIYAFGWGGPSVGFTANAGLVMGRPQILPSLIQLPGGLAATVGAFAEPPTRGDQIAVYGNVTVTVPAGHTGFVAGSDAPQRLLRGSKTIVNSAGLNMAEPVAGFRIEEPNSPYRTVAMPLLAPPTCASGACPAGSQVIVPEGATVLVARVGSVAEAGLQARLTAGKPVTMSVDDGGWDAIDDVMGGKPQLVNAGVPVAQQPSFVDDWQWVYAHWRPAVVHAASGKNWLVVAGGKNGVGIRGDTWAKMLAQMGARTAMGFDNNSSTELLRIGASPVTAYSWERSIPSAIALSYRP
jgi:hypothetical protein